MVEETLYTIDNTKTKEKLEKIKSPWTRLRQTILCSTKVYEENRKYKQEEPGTMSYYSVEYIQQITTNLGLKFKQRLELTDEFIEFETFNRKSR